MNVKNLRILTIIQGKDITNYGISTILNSIKLNSLVIGNLDKITNFKVSSNIQLQNFACYRCQSIDNYGLINILQFSPNLEKFKIHNCNCINDNIFEILYNITTKKRNKILTVDVNTFLINNLNLNYKYNNNIEYKHITLNENFSF